MALKVLAQNRPGAAAVTPFYVVPASKAVVAGSITICNTDGANDDSFIVYVVPSSGGAYGGSGGGSSGGAPSVANIIFNETVVYKSSFVGVVGLSLAAGDAVYIYAVNGRLTFSLFGDES